MNDIFSTFGVLDWKPWVSALLLPPVPLLLLLLLAWWLQRRRPALATMLLMVAVLGLWFSHCQVTGALLEQRLALHPSLSITRLAELRRNADANRTAIVVLGSSARALAPEYGESHLDNNAMERLHYGLWLGRQLTAPVLYSGGTGRGHVAGTGEATVAARMANRDYGRSLRWVENESHDTRGNARLSLAMLQKDGITQVVLVTHGWHMRRALRAFEQEAEHAGMSVRTVPAPMGLIVDRTLTGMQRWWPSAEGHQRVRQALREWIGLLAGA